jgi:phosphohistidine phosphatase
MDLILWRHADAVDGGPDLSRELTPKGHEQASKMAEWLKHRIPNNTRILVSPATRTQQTAEALRRKFQTINALSPGADAMTLLLTAGWPDGGDTVLLIGHQPGLGQAAMLLLSGQETDLSIKKGGMVWISNRVRKTTQQQHILRVALSPEMI